MSRWLQNELFKSTYSPFSQRQHFLGQLIIFVFCAHVLLMTAAIILSSVCAHKERFFISFQKSGATYVLMPLSKKAENQNQLKEQKQAGIKSKIIDHETYLQHKQNKQSKKSSTLIVTQRQQKKSTISGSVTKSNLSSKKPSIKDKSSIMLQSEGKKNNFKKLPAHKQEIVSLEISVIAEENSELAALPIQAPIEALAMLPDSETLLSPVEVATEQPQESVNLIDDVDLDNVIFVGYQELDNCVIGAKIQHIIEQHWTPPVGMSKNYSCELSVHVGADGIADHVKIIKSSGALVYDTQACKTLRMIKTEYPKQVWNKTISIVLGA